MNLNKLSREDLIRYLKRNMILCNNSFSIDHIDWDTGDKEKVNFNKGEYYFVDNNEGGIWIIHDNGMFFDIYDDSYKDIIERGFSELKG